MEKLKLERGKVLEREIEHCENQVSLWRAATRFVSGDAVNVYFQFGQGFASLCEDGFTVLREICLSHWSKRLEEVKKELDEL